MLLECEPVNFTTLVREAAQRSAQFSSKLIEQVLDARHAGGASASRLIAECTRIIERASAPSDGAAVPIAGPAGGSSGNAVEAHDKFWSQLRKTERVAAVSLGWDAMSWDEGIAVGICGSSWSTLGPRQKEAAATLGYTAESWDRMRAAAAAGGSAGAGGVRRALSRNGSRSSSAGGVSGCEEGEAAAAAAAAAGGGKVGMSQDGRVALMAAVRRIAMLEGSDRFDSLSLRDIRLQLPAALSAVTSGGKKRTCLPVCVCARTELACLSYAAQPMGEHCNLRWHADA
jgi:hypothetical protein